MFSLTENINYLLKPISFLSGLNSWGLGVISILLLSNGILFSSNSFNIDTIIDPASRSEYVKNFKLRCCTVDFSK